MPISLVATSFILSSNAGMANEQIDLRTANSSAEGQDHKCRPYQVQ